MRWLSILQVGLCSMSWCIPLISEYYSLSSVYLLFWRVPSLLYPNFIYIIFLPLLVQFPMFPSQQEVSCWKHREQSRRDHVYGFCVQSILFLYRNGTCWVLYLYQIYWCWFLIPPQINYYLYLLEKTGFLFLKNIDFFYR